MKRLSVARRGRRWTFAALLCVASCCFSTVRGGDGGNASGANDFTFRAVWFDEGNLRAYHNYGPAPILGNNGEYPNRAEYKLTFPKDGVYKLSALFAAQESRPVTFFLDGETLATNALAETTGSWNSETAAWRDVAEFEAKAGEHVLSFSRETCISHIVAFRLSPRFDGPVDWPTPRAAVDFKYGANANFETRDPAIDRARKGESGETFEDHFGLETAAALVPEDELSVEVLPQKTLKPDWNNELTYSPEMFAAQDETSVAAAPMAVRIASKKAARSTEVAAPADFTVEFKVDVNRRRLLLEKSRKLLATLTERFGEDEVAEKFGPDFSTLAETFDARLNGLNAWNAKLSDEPSDADKEAFVREFLADVRLYSRLGRANPLFDFDDILFVRRNARHLGLVNNWVSNSALNPKAFDDGLYRLKLDGSARYPAVPREVYRPEKPAFVGDVDLHFDGEKVLFSSTRENGQWNVFETKLEKDGEKIVGTPAKELLPNLPDANSYDACYLPDESIVYTSSACYIAVPCVNGSTRVTNTYRMYADEKKTIRRLTFDQEHNWHPTVTEDGRILYQRWEYADIPHAHSRLLFLMNPDGTNQNSFYGTNSYWPNSMFYARPIPGEPTKFVAIVTGHHGVPRMGELVLFDVRKGRKEASGAVRRICAKTPIVASKTDPKYDDTLIVDTLVDEAWPKFLHPFPLDGDYYLASARLNAQDGWGIYLVDTDDNMILLSKEKGFAHFEPIPLRPTERPPVIADRIDESRDDATVFIADIYFGDGLKNVPRGTVKYLRLFTYNYLYPNMGGTIGGVGAEGPCDVRNTLGVVPVEPNGSALFKVPANTPISIQPLDENGKALQIMRSWFTAMPGENLSCVGCHEDQNSVSPSSLDPTVVQRMKTSEIEYWRGPSRGFSFRAEVQPVLDRYCVACHNGDESAPLGAFDLRGLENIKGYGTYFPVSIRPGNWSTSYDALHRYVRRPGMESDYHLLMPTEFGAETTDLYKLLLKGHYGVRLDAESWDRLLTWIDLNAPYHGYWGEQGDSANAARWNKLRRDVMELYKSGGVDQEVKRPTTWDPKVAAETTQTNWSAIPKNPFAAGPNDVAPFADGEAVRAAALAKLAEKTTSDAAPLLDWAFDAPEAKKRQADEAERLFGDRTKTSTVLEPIPGLKMEFRLIPAGTFVMGAQSPDGPRYDDEKPCVVEIKRSFWMSVDETTNALYELVEPSHDSGVESRHGFQFGVRGFYVNGPELPVVRVSWNDANAFCQKISEASGQTFRLPSEAEWEYACRAGTATSMNYGAVDADFSRFANLADATLRNFVCHQYFKEIKLERGAEFDHWIPRIANVEDGGFLSEKPRKYEPNAWGLFDMHGNVSEWTASLAKPNPTADGDAASAEGERVVRGGSWYDRPINARSEYRTSLRPWQGSFNVGFRVVCEIPEAAESETAEK